MSSGPTADADVLVLGMPSSGKTVFLSVLGRSFTLVADDSDARPLGFRMRAIGRSTQEAVSRNYARLLGGEWPASTVAGTVTPLRWDVFTGTRKVFTLSSLDVSGESFVKAFCDEGRDAIRREGEDGLLDMAQHESGTPDAVELLRIQAMASKVICFFVNIAAGRRGQALANGGRRAGQIDIDAVQNFETGVANICALLDELPSLRSKALVVLTQAHRHQAEIEKAGGPAAFLGRIAPNLRQTVAEFNIPVIAVSAINERDSEDWFDDEDDDNAVPETINSDGLFGFLLVVAGMIPDARLAVLKDRYLRYLSDKARYSQLTRRTILERMPLIRAYAESGAAFGQACLEYVADPVNLNAPGAEPLSRPATDLYRRCTMSDRDVAFAASAWKRRLAVDSAWDRVFRRIVLVETKQADSGDVASAPTVAEIVGAVRSELERDQPGGLGLSDSALYGFESDELDPARDAPDEKSWVMRCLEEYRLRMVSDLEGCMQLYSEARRMLVEIDPNRGGDYGLKKEALVEAIAKCRDLLVAFDRDWCPSATVGGLPQLDNLGHALEELSASVQALEREHSKWLDAAEIERRRKAIAQARAEKIASAIALEQAIALRKRRLVWRLAGAGAAAVLLAVLFFAVRQHHAGQNVSRRQRAVEAYNQGDYQEAENQLGLIRDQPFFLLRRRDFVSPAFEVLVVNALTEQREKYKSAVKGCDDSRGRAVAKGAEKFANSELREADGRRYAAESDYSQRKITFREYLHELDKCRKLYDSAVALSAKESKVDQARRNCDQARSEARKRQADVLYGKDFESVEEERLEADRLYANGKGSLDSGSYVAKLSKIVRRYEAVKAKAEARQVSLAQEECDNAHAVALKCAANVSTTASEFILAATSYDNAKQDYLKAAIGADEYLEKLGAITRQYLTMIEVAKQARTDSAKRMCSQARDLAIKNDAVLYASSALKAADNALAALNRRYAERTVDLELYLTKMAALAEQYRQVEKTAIANAKPLATITAMLAGTGEKVTGAQIKCNSRIVGDTPVMDCDFGGVSAGNQVLLEARCSVKGISYRGSLRHTVGKGRNECCISLSPEYTLNIDYCPFCDPSNNLLPSKHVRVCPRCKSDLSLYLR